MNQVCQVRRTINHYMPNCIMVLWTEPLAIPQGSSDAEICIPYLYKQTPTDKENVKTFLCPGKCVWFTREVSDAIPVHDTLTDRHFQN